MACANPSHPVQGTAVTKNASEKKVNSLLDFMGQVWGKG